MSYQGYVIAAYSVFVAVLLWDFLAARLRTRGLLRRARALAERQAAARPLPPDAELPR